MIVRFGLKLDGMQPAVPRTAAGEAVLGPTRLIERLELELGLAPVRERPGEALLAYRACVIEADTPQRFYHRSLAVDALAVARSLLGWRNRWHEAGWRGEFPAGASRRLADLAAVERLAAVRVPLCSGQRLQRIAAAVSAARTESPGEVPTQIERILLHDPPAALPAAWRAVLAHFETTPADGVEPAPSAPAGTDLASVQAALLELAGERGDGRVPEVERLGGDGSLIVIDGVSRDVSAQAVAEYLIEHGIDDTVVVAERDGIIVDNALERVGLARAGFQHYSRFRAVTQVLKLTLGLLWEPVNPQLLLQFLIHPVGPLPRGVRIALAEAVAAEPGIGGRAWRRTLAAVIERQRERGLDAAAIGRLERDIAHYLECRRYSPEGAPIAALLEQTQRCGTWLARQLHGRATSAENDLFGAAQAQCEALLDALSSLRDGGRDRLPKLELERLVDEVTGHAPDPGTFAEAGHVRATTEPAAITGRWRTVIWWDLAAPRSIREDPWSPGELTELEACGVELPSQRERIRLRTRQWLQPLLNARSHALLVVHDRDEGHHPLWSQLTSRFDGFERVRVDAALLDGGAPARLPALGVETAALRCRPLPAPQRWWQLGDGAALERRAVESYSSLQRLIDYPHAWVLHYPARLRTGRAADLARGNLLLGNLAHRLFETFFDEHGEGWAALDAAALDAWLAMRLPALVAAEGAVLFEPGGGVARQAAMTTLEAALRRLLAHLRGAGIERVQAEAPAAAAFDGLELRGAIDLLLEDAAGREIVLDVKWGSERHRGRLLEANRHLQLATYAFLRREARGAWPYQAFFIVASGNIVAQDDGVFADAVRHAPAEPLPVERLWERLAATAAWRWGQLAAGRIEVNRPGTEPTAESRPPAGTLEIATEADPFDPFTHLTGWEPGA